MWPPIVARTWNPKAWCCRFLQAGMKTLGLSLLCRQGVCVYVATWLQRTIFCTRIHSKGVYTYIALHHNELWLLGTRNTLWKMWNNVIFLPFIKQQTEAPNNHSDVFPPTGVLFKADTLLALSKQLLNNTGELCRKERKLYIILVNNIYFAKSFMIRINPGWNCSDFASASNRDEHSHPLLLATFEKK